MNIALPVAAVLIIGVSNAVTCVITRAYSHRARYSEGYRDCGEQIRFDAEMDEITGYDAHAAYLEATGDSEVTS